MGVPDNATDQWHLTPEEIRETTERILERAEFAGGPMEKPWVQKVWEAVKHILEGLGNWAAAHPTGQKILVSILGIILVGLIVFIVSTFLREFAPGRSLRRSRRLGKSVTALLGGEIQSWEQAFAAAETALTSGDYYRAVWIGHRLYLALLDFVGVIKFAKWKTNLDYLNECSDDDARCHALREFNTTYENIVYAHRSTDSEHVRRFLDLVAELRCYDTRP